VHKQSGEASAQVKELQKSNNDLTKQLGHKDAQLKAQVRQKSPGTAEKPEHGRKSLMVAERDLKQPKEPRDSRKRRSTAERDLTHPKEP